MELPEGWKAIDKHISELHVAAEEYEKEVQKKYNNPHYVYMFSDFYCAVAQSLDLMQEMAEALEDLVNNPYEPIGHDGREALKKFKEWK